MAIVHVPTSPNPTSGYMEIVPVEDVIEQTGRSMKPCISSPGGFLHVS